MAEEQEGGGRGEVKLPGIGGANKKMVIAIGGAGAAYVLWRYWQARKSAAADAATPQDPGMTDPGTLPSVAGAVSPTNAYGISDATGATGTSAFGFHGTTNSEWSQYAANQLAAASDKWSFGDVVTALGAFIGNRPLSSTQQQIVQAAIALAGPPPEGTHPIIPGGDVPITVAPTGLKVTSTTETEADLTWTGVPGAAGYRIYRSGVSEVVGVANSTTGRVGGLTPNTSYSFQVAAFTASGQIGPKSTPATGRTKAVTLARPTGLKVSGVTRNAATVSCAPVAGATYYHWYLDGHPSGASDHPSYTFTGLHPNSAHKAWVNADTTNQSSGPPSNPISFRTKK